MNTNESNEQIFKRLGALEQENASIVTSIRSLSTSVEKLSKNVEAMQSQSKTNWGVLASWATVVLVIMGVYGNMAIRPMGARIERLDTNLQREMRDVNNVTEAKVEHLDMSLQREMRLLLDSQNEKIDGLETRLEASEKLLHEHANKDGHPIKQNYALDQINERLDRIASP